MALVEMHLDLAKVRIGSRDISYKCKQRRKGDEEVGKWLLGNKVMIQNLEQQVQEAKEKAESTDTGR